MKLLKLLQKLARKCNNALRKRSKAKSRRRGALGGSQRATERSSDAGGRGHGTEGAYQRTRAQEKQGKRRVPHPPRVGRGIHKWKDGRRERKGPNSAHRHKNGGKEKRGRSRRKGGEKRKKREEEEGEGGEDGRKASGGREKRAGRGSGENAISDSAGAISRKFWRISKKVA